MSRIQSIHKRKAKKLYGYFFLSGGIFFVVLALCIGGFFLFRHKNILRSPIGELSLTSSRPTTNEIGDVQFLCTKHNLSCNNITEDGDSITFTVNNSTVFISTIKDMDKQIGSLQLTIRALTMEGKEFHRLDFRYDRPVISN